MRSILFRQSTPLTDSLEVLTQEWGGGRSVTPTLFDVMAVRRQSKDHVPRNRCTLKWTIRDTHARSRETPNADVCLHSDSDRFFQFLLPRLMEQRLGMDSSIPGCSPQAEKK